MQKQKTNWLFHSGTEILHLKYISVRLAIASRMEMIHLKSISIWLGSTEIDFPLPGEYKNTNLCSQIHLVISILYGIPTFEHHFNQNQNEMPDH